MTIYFSVAFFILGAIIGSFLNVVLYRLNTGRGLGGRSKCPSCKRTLSAIDLVPIFSWLFLRGKCRTCKSKISAQYILVELLTAVLFTLAFLKNAILLRVSPSVFAVSTIVSLIIMSLLVLIIVYDLKHKIIPNEFSYTFAAVALLQNFLSYNYQTASIYFSNPFNLAGATILLSGILVAFPFYLLWLVSSGKWMGFGDAKLALGIGWLLGVGYGFSAIVFAFWIGAIVALLIMAVASLLKYIYKKTKGRVGILHSVKFKTEIPFAPFLIIGLLIVFFFNVSALDFISIFTW